MAKKKSKKHISRTKSSKKPVPKSNPTSSNSKGLVIKIGMVVIIPLAIYFLFFTKDKFPILPGDVNLSIKPRPNSGPVIDNRTSVVVAKWTKGSITCLQGQILRLSRS